MCNILIVTKNLFIINVLASAAMYVFRLQVDLNDILELHFLLTSDFWTYQSVTCMFMHASFEHISFNMFALWMFGRIVERVWGPKRSLFCYTSYGIGVSLFQELARYSSYVVEGLAIYDSVSFDGMRMAMDDFLNKWTTVGTPEAVYALLLAFDMIFPGERIFIFPLPIPTKAKQFVILYAGLSLVMVLITIGGSVAHFTHLGGMVLGFLMIRYWRHHPYDGSSRSDGRQFFDNLREKQEEHTHKRADNTKHDVYDERQSDWDYNTQKQREQEEMDKVLDKIRKNGYGNLTAEEK